MANGLIHCSCVMVIDTSEVEEPPKSDNDNDNDNDGADDDNDNGESMSVVSRPRRAAARTGMIVRREQAKKATQRKKNTDTTKSNGNDKKKGGKDKEDEKYSTSFPRPSRAIRSGADASIPTVFIKHKNHSINHDAPVSIPSYHIIHIHSTPSPL
jgi:hypothetical protein